MTQTEDYGNFIMHIRRILAAALDKTPAEIFFEQVPTADAYLEDELFIRRGDAGLIGIRVRPLYERYRQGAEIEGIATALVKSMKQDELPTGISVIKNLRFFIKNSADYDKIKEKLVIRAVSRERNRILLEDCLYQTAGDIALTLYAAVNGDRDGLYSIRIPRSLFSAWKLPEEEIIRDALRNTEKRFPPRIYPCPQLLSGFPDEPAGEFMDSKGTPRLDGTEAGNCLTNPTRQNGAVSVFFPGVASRIAALWKDDFYIVFTSVHEAMIHKASASNPGHLRAALEGAAAFLKEDKTEFLSRHIYYYSRKGKKFGIVNP